MTHSMTTLDIFLIAATVIGGLALLAQVVSIVQTQLFMNALEDLKGAVYDLQTTVGLAVAALQRPVVPADEVQAQANAIKNAVDSLRQNLPPIPPS